MIFHTQAACLTAETHHPRLTSSAAWAAESITIPIVNDHAGLWETTLAMIAIMWQFEVKDGRETEFEQLYGVNGEWTAMNRQTRSYLGSSFLRDQTLPSRYVVIEYWSEMVVYEQHRSYRSDAITTFEARRTEIVKTVEPLGVYTALDVPDRTGPTWSYRR